MPAGKGAAGADVEENAGVPHVKLPLASIAEAKSPTEHEVACAPPLYQVSLATAGNAKSKLMITE